ncbi:unnamed protein product [Rhizopus stolonifer]
MLHLLPLVPKQNQKRKHVYSFLSGDGSFGDPYSQEQVVRKRFSVRVNFTLELCLAQFCSALGKHMVDINLNFYGVQIAGKLANGKSILRLEPRLTRLDMSAPLCREDTLNVKFSLSNLRKYLRPIESDIKHMHPDRVTLLNSLVDYQLDFHNDFAIDTATTIVACLPTVMNQLYEHFLAGVVGIVYDANRKAVIYLDVFNQKIKLSQKADYIITLQLSTENESVLEKLKDIICELDLDLKSVSFDGYQNVSDVYIKAFSLTKFSLESKDTKVFYIAVPDGKDAFTKEVKAGDALAGKLEFTSSVKGGQYKVIYTAPSLVTEPKDKAEKEKTNRNKTRKRITSKPVRI